MPIVRGYWNGGHGMKPVICDKTFLNQFSCSRWYLGVNFVARVWGILLYETSQLVVVYHIITL